jgi:hypothetical protein
MKNLLGIMAVVALLAAPALADGNTPLPAVKTVAVTASIATYSEINLSDATIDFGAMVPTEVNLISDDGTTGGVVATDTASGTITSNTAISVAYNNGPNLTSGTNQLETWNSSQILGGEVTFNGQTFTMTSEMWTPWGPANEAGVVLLKACTTYTMNVRCKVERNGLMDPQGNYTKTVTLTLSAV